MMTVSRVALLLLTLSPRVLAQPAAPTPAAEPHTAAQPGATQTATAKPPAAMPATTPGAPKTPERIDPSEKISEDLSVSFPSDI